MLLEKGAKTEVSEIFERCNLTPNVHFTTWDDYAIMSMVESGLGISILPESDFEACSIPDCCKRIRCARIPENRGLLCGVKDGFTLQSSGSWNICNIVKILYRKVYKQRILYSARFSVEYRCVVSMK